MLSTDENLPTKQNATSEASSNDPENTNSVLSSIVLEMSLEVLNRIESKVITEPLPVSKSSLTRGINGLKLDDKTIRTIACLYYKTEDLDALLNLVPNCLKETIENANNKLSHQGVVPFEVARNPGLAKLWNLSLGYGCPRELGERYFGEEFSTMINTLVEYKLVTKSILHADLWIANGEMILNREDLLFHYDQMAALTRPILDNPELSKPIQYCGEMSRESFVRLQEKMLEVFHEHVRKESLIESDKKEVKFNFQVSLCELGSNMEGSHEIQ